MKSRLILTTLLALTLGQASAQKDHNLTIGTGSPTGIYFPVGTGMAKLINESKSGLSAAALNTSGSVDNLQALAAGKLDMAIVQSDLAYYALSGSNLPVFAGKPNFQLRSLAVLYPEVLHIVARTDAGINSIPRLKGKRVIVGDPGSGTEQTARQILNLYGMNFDDLGEAIRVSPNQAASYLKDKRADAVFYTVGVGSSAVQSLMQAAPVTLIPVAGAQALNLVKKYPFYVRKNIPAGTYAAVKKETLTVAVSAVLVTTTAVSDQDAYKAMKAIFDSESDVKAMHPVLNTNFGYEKAVDGLPALLHPGAAKFFTEKGISVKVR